MSILQNQRKEKDYLENKVKTQHNAQITSSHPTGSGWPVRVQRATDARIDQTQCTRVQARCTKGPATSRHGCQGHSQGLLQFQTCSQQLQHGGVFLCPARAKQNEYCKAQQAFSNQHMGMFPMEKGKYLNLLYLFM